MCPLGLEVEKIHTCKNDCILYRGPKYEDIDKFPICELERFNRRKDGGNDENHNNLGIISIIILGLWLNI
jgi:hypothetical protein